MSGSPISIGWSWPYYRPCFPRKNEYLLFSLGPLYVKLRGSKMNNVLNIKERQLLKKTNNKQPPTNWLSELPVGTVFLAKRRGEFPSLEEAHVVFKTDKSVKLLDNSDNHDYHFWVDPISYCRDFDLFEVLKEGDE